MVRLSQRVQAIAGSPTFALVRLKNQLLDEGKTVYDFGAGEPDFPTPGDVKRAGIAAIKKNFTKYTPAAGIAELKTAIQKAYLDEQGYMPAAVEIIVSPGSKFGLLALLEAVVDPGDQVIIPRPYWVSYPEMIRYCGGEVVFADHLLSDPIFEITADSYIGQAGPKTKAVILNSPANPTGMIMKKEELEKLIDFFSGRGILVIVDDCYRHIRFGGDAYPSPFGLRSAAKDRLAVVSSLSKTFSMTGWRIGYTIAAEPLCAAMTRIYEHSVSNACSISQKAAVEALRGDRSDVARMVEEYRKRRDFIARRFDEIGNIRYRLPEGAFYLFADFSHYIKKKGLPGDREMVMDLLNRHNVIMVPGSAFGAAHYIRLSFATSMAGIRKGLERIQAYLLEG